MRKWSDSMWCLALVVSLFAGGCASPKPTRFDVVVSIDDSLGTTSVAVDLVGANQSLASTLSNVPVSSYFSPGNKVREGVDRTTLRFVDDDRAPKTLSRTDPIWEMWLQKNATELFVIANLLGEFADLPGDADSRRLILPLTADRWDGRTIRIVVKEGFVEAATAPKPAKD